MFKFKSIMFFSFFLLISLQSFSMVYDNRFFPFFKRPYSKKIDRLSRFAVDFFATHADSALGEHEECQGIPELFGVYDLEKLGRAAELLGYQNPIRDEWRGFRLPWKMNGEIDSQGLAFTYDQAIFAYFYIGCSWLFMRTHSHHCFIFDRQEATLKLDEDNIVALDDARRKMHQILCLEPQANQLGIGDFDFYVRVGKVWDHTLKFRRIDFGGKVGFLIPSGEKMSVFSPASVPFGGDGFPGIYSEIDLELELKEDMKFGFLARLSKRFEKKVQKRVPILDEHPLFGALRTDVIINPGPTFVLAPYFGWENIRKGFGARAGYTIVVHGEDEWKSPTVPVDLKDVEIDMCKINKTTSWMTDYVDLEAFYDFGECNVYRSHLYPVITASWDIPANVLVGRDAIKTHRVTLGIEINF